MGGPFLLAHALIEDDLLFVLERLKNFARLVQEPIAKRAVRFADFREFRRAFGLPIVDLRQGDFIQPFLDDFLYFHYALALPRTVQNQHRQFLDPSFD